MGRLQALRPRLGGLAARLPAAPKVAEGFYTSTAWRALVRSIKRERGNRCERPGCGSADRVIADHKVERKDGGAELDPSNIELLCAAHHNAKTAEARARRAKGRRS